jgi:hypothetical protein
MNNDIIDADRKLQSERIISAVSKKLEANRQLLGRSRNGHVKWRVVGNKVEVDLQPTL